MKTEAKQLTVSWAEWGWNIDIPGTCGPARKLSLVTSAATNHGRDAWVLDECSRDRSRSCVTRSQARFRAFTIIELLVVISIIGVLAGLIFPALAHAQKKAKVTKAKLEMKDLETAIKAYEAEYNRFPASLAAEQAPGPDFTYVGTNNAEVIEILLDLPRGPNQQHMRNPRQHVFFHAKMVANGPGVSTVDDVFRDPWGNPYVITMDMNGDEFCADALYAAIPPTKGGLANIGLTTIGGTNLLHSNVMIWSMGPDGLADRNVGPKEGVNADNVLGWQ